jgi:hypothetical protein
MNGTHSTGMFSGNFPVANKAAQFLTVHESLRLSIIVGDDKSKKEL